MNLVNLAQTHSFICKKLKLNIRSFSRNNVRTKVFNIFEVFNYCGLKQLFIFCICRWVEIAKFLCGQSDNSIENFWNKHCKKKLIKKKNPTSLSINFYYQPVFTSPENNWQIQVVVVFLLRQCTSKNLSKLQHSTFLFINIVAEKLTHLKKFHPIYKAFSLP